MAIVFAIGGVIGGAIIGAACEDYSNYSNYSDYSDYDDYEDYVERSNQRELQFRNEQSFLENTINTYKSNDMNPYLTGDCYDGSGIDFISANSTYLLDVNAKDNIAVEQNREIDLLAGDLSVEIDEVNNLINKIDTMLSKK